VTAQRLDRVLTAYRIGDPNGTFPIFDATGSKLFPGRWNTSSSPVIYTSEHYSTVMLEILARADGSLPPNQHFITITLPNGLSYEVVSPAHLPGWDDASCTPSQRFGEAWQQQRRSLLLLVPSVVARMETNILINPEHPEFHQVTHSLHLPVWWDARLFPPPA
jgi:RES domain-containing protein